MKIREEAGAMIVLRSYRASILKLDALNSRQGPARRGMGGDIRQIEMGNHPKPPHSRRAL